MPASKIVDEQEVLRWFEEGRTYDWMVEQYRSKYNIDTVPSMWGNFRRRRGIDRRFARDDNLIPWAVKREHRWAFDVMMLRAAGRRRAGLEQAAIADAKLDSWLQTLAEDDAVVHYDPETEEGFFRVPRRKGVDLDLIREPDHKTSNRLNSDREPKTPKDLPVS